MSPLATELTNPLYADLSDEDAAAIIDAKRVAIRSLVPTYLVRRKTCEGLYWSDLVDSCESSEVMLKKLSRAMMIWINDTSGIVQTIDMDLPEVVSVLAGLVSFGVITQPQADALSALADTEIPWSESVGIAGPIGAGLVHNARLEINDA